MHRNRLFLPLLVVGLAAAVGYSAATGEDAPSAAKKPAVAPATGGELVFGDGVARLTVTHDPNLGTLTFRYVGGTRRVVSAPVVTIRDESGSRRVALATLEPSVWRLYEPALLEDDAQLAATVEIQADGRYTANLVRSLWMAAEPVVAEHGGRVVAFRDCPAHVEVVRDEIARTVTFVPLDETPDGKSYVLEKPEIVVPNERGARVYALARVEGEPGAWRLATFVPESNVEATLRFTVHRKRLETKVRLSPFSPPR